MKFLRLYLLAILVFNLAACSTMQEVSIQGAMQNSSPHGVDYGSLVHVRMLDKTSAKFRVTVINADGLGGSENFYRYENMADLKVESAKSNDTNIGTILLGVLGVAALVYLVANADSVSVCSSTPCESP